MTKIPSLPMKLALQVFARREAAGAETEAQSPYRNFLIIAPGSVGVATVPDETVVTLARHLNQDGYAYVARPNQKEMEDDPSGGAVSAVEPSAAGVWGDDGGDCDW